MPKLLSRSEIKERLKQLDGWRYEDGFIIKRFEFARFLDGVEFIDAVAAVAEEQEHHPDIHVRYTEITLSIQTHSEMGVTVWDLELAAAIDRVKPKGLGPPPET